jgi:TolA-binding protein
MATDTAPTSRNIWQLPTFLVGIAALVAVWYGRPYLHLTPAEQYQRDLAALRQALDKNPVDLTFVQAQLRKVQGVDPPPQSEKLVAYLIGSALVATAELAVTPEEAVEQWKSARKLLETASGNGVADNDRLRHQYRLAKAWAHTGEAPQKVIDALVASMKCGDDPSDGNRILAETYLKLDPPREKEARDCLKEYMTQMPPGRGEAQQRYVNLARLKLGELHTKLGEPDDARKVLERIGPDAPPDLLVAARILLAKSYEVDEDWEQAIRCLEQARDIRGILPADKAGILYGLAEAYQKANKKARALEALQLLWKGTGPEAQAAAFRLGEYQVADSAKQEAAVLAFEAAVNDVSAAAFYVNKLLPLSEARALLEDAALKLRTAGVFDLAVRIARAYAHIAENGHDHELAAEALQAWGQGQLDKAPFTDAVERPRLVEEGTKHCREAAEEWCAAAAAKNTTLEKGDPLFRAAELFFKAGDLPAALKTLDEIGLKVPDFPQDKLAEVWLKKGEVYVALDNREQARLCFQNGIQIAERHPSPTLLRCRIHLAEVLLKSADPTTIARALADLEKALADPKFADDKELHESALEFVADAYYRQKDYHKALVRFSSLLSTFPESPRTLNSRFMLGQCYWFIAGQEAAKCNTARKIIDDPNASDERKRDAELQFQQNYGQYREWLKKASEPFKTVESELLKGMANPRLSPKEAELLRRASLYAADCAFYSEQFDECLARYDAVAERYAGTYVQLEALRSKWFCYQYYQDGKSDKAADTLTQLRTVFLNLPDSEFDGTSEFRRREYWQKWFDQNTPMKKQ